MSDIVEIKPHDKPEEYVFEDVPIPATDRNRVSAIFMNWVKSRLLNTPYILESDRWSDGSSYTYYEKWSDGRLIMMGKKEITETQPKNGLVLTVYNNEFHRPINFVGLKNYVSAEPYLYDGINSFALFDVKFDRMRPTDLNGSLKVDKTSGAWSSSNKAFGIIWREEGFWK